MKNKDFRIDSQFYTQEPKKNKLLIYDKIGNIIEKAQYGVSIAMNEDNVGYPIYRMNEIHSMMCDLEVSKSAEITNSELETFRLNNRDVLFNRTNSFEWVGRTGLYKKYDDRNFVFASYLVRFIPNQKIILPEYLTAFLNSKQGIWDVKRRARQSINQTNVNPEEVKNIDIPILSLLIQNKIKDCFDKAYDNILISTKEYSLAEKLVLNELGLLEFNPSIEPVNVKSFKESFGVTGRLDSEYYQKRYEDYSKLVRSYSHGFARLDVVCDLKLKNFIPDNETLYKYIELSNIGKTGDISGCTNELGKDLPTRARRMVFENDVIISSIEGSLQSCALITKEYDKALCSTGFYVVQSDKINSETLLVLFKSELMQNILKQNCSGTILTGINKDEISGILIPMIANDVQIKVTELLKRSFKLKKQSEHLLEIAKRSVEIAIEQNEAEALEFIEQNVAL